MKKIITFMMLFSITLINRIAADGTDSSDENPKCIACKFLPLCWGPCCQKILEDSERIEKYCQLNNLEMSIEDFIKYRVNNELIRQENEKD